MLEKEISIQAPAEKTTITIKDTQKNSFSLVLYKISAVEFVEWLKQDMHDNIKVFRDNDIFPPFKARKKRVAKKADGSEEDSDDDDDDDDSDDD